MLNRDAQNGKFIRNSGNAAKIACTVLARFAMMDKAKTQKERNRYDAYLL